MSKKDTKKEDWRTVPGDKDTNYPPSIDKKIRDTVQKLLDERKGKSK